MATKTSQFVTTAALADTDYILAVWNDGGTVKSAKILKSDLIPTAASILPRYALLVDSKSVATAGGTFTSGAWQIRTLNTTVHDVNISLSLSSNKFTLPAGSYIIRVTAPAYRVEDHVARLYNVTDSAVAATGTAAFSVNGSSGAATNSFIHYYAALGSSKEFRVEHRCNTTRTTDGFGIAVANVNQSANLFTVVEIHRIA